MELKADLDAVLAGRILAAVVIIVSFAYSVKYAVSASSNGFWIFLSNFTIPLAVAFGIIMVTEVLRELRKREG